jgi:hypothetical protein
MFFGSSEKWNTFSVIPSGTIIGCTGLVHCLQQWASILTCVASWGCHSGIKMSPAGMQLPCRASSSEGTTSEAAVKDATSQQPVSDDPALEPTQFPPHVAAATGPAAATVRKFYAAYNRGDFDALPELFAEDCVYYDAVYLEPKFGHAAVTAYFQKFKQGASVDNLCFDVTEMAGDGVSCGVAW